MTTTTTKPLAHRKDSYPTYSNNLPTKNNELLEKLTYGVPAPKRMLTPSLLLKRYDTIRSYLSSIGLTPAERQIAFELLRLYAYYGKVYPKAYAFADIGGCSKRSFWRAVAKLEETGVIDRINRYIDHLQISNCYRLDKLILCLIRYLSEHGLRLYDQFTLSILRLTSFSFWTTIKILRVRLRDPNPLTINA